MKQNSLLWRVGVLICMVLLPGCMKYYDVSEKEFPQAQKEPDHREVRYAYKRTQRVYDQFETKAIFDALWLSDDVRTAYVQMYAKKRGLSAEAKEELLKRQLEENKHWVAFYVLADIREQGAGRLGDAHTAWTMFASLDKHLVRLESIKEYDLEPEYQLLFGAVGMNFKTCYLVKCALQPEIANQIGCQQFKHLALTVNSPKHKAVLEWRPEQLKAHKNLLSDEDFYWGD